MWVADLTLVPHRRNKMDVYVIAEIGSVHDGSKGNALKLVELAASTGANAVKFQTHIAEAETLKSAPSPSYFSDEPRFDYFNRTGFDLREWQELKSAADELGVDFLSSPFSVAALELLEELGTPFYKVPSGEVTNLDLLSKIANTRKHVFLSSGMSNWSELDVAIETISKVHNKITVLQCSSLYPCPAENVGLNVISEMGDRWGLPVGFSDHTIDNYAAFAAVTLGACVIEKHLTFSKLMYGSDALNAAEPDQFVDMVRGIRQISQMIANKTDKDDLSIYSNMKKTFEKSIVSIVEIPKGTTISRDMIALKKPGTGLGAAHIDTVVGSIATQDIPPDEIITIQQMKS